MVTVTLDGLGHVGGGAHVTLATHPGAVTEPSLLKRNVKHPFALEAVKGPGKLAPVKLPQYEPGKPPGTLPPALLLANC